MERNIIALFLLLALGLISSASAEGEYRKVANGKVKVWTDEARPGELARWTGKADEDGYATGKGTLTWYTTKGIKLTGANVPFIRKNVTSHQTGTMAKGKLTGSVLTVDAEGKKFEDEFANGKQGKGAKKEAKVVAKSPPPISKPQKMEPVAPAEGPTRKQSAAAKERIAKADAPASATAARAPETAPAPEPQAREMTSSLRSLINPPSLLHVKNETAREETAPAPDQSRPQLTATEAIELADAAARSHGYQVGDYQRSPARFGTAEGAWSVTYDRATSEAAGKTNGRFTVTVEDKSRNTSVAGDN